MLTPRFLEGEIEMVMLLLLVLVFFESGFLCAPLAVLEDVITFF